MTKGEHMNVRTYVRTGQTLYPLHNFVVLRDNKGKQSFLFVTHCLNLIEIASLFH